jgi:hypothetical protein
MVALTDVLRSIHLDKQHVKPSASAPAKCADQSGVEMPFALGKKFNAQNLR